MKRERCCNRQKEWQNGFLSLQIYFDKLLIAASHIHIEFLPIKIIWQSHNWTHYHTSFVHVSFYYFATVYQSLLSLSKNDLC